MRGAEEAALAAITLYQVPGTGGLSLSPYCNKVHWALRLKGLVYRTEDVTRPGALSETSKLPLLVHDGDEFHNSSEILRALESRHPDPPLIPHDKRLAAQALVLEEWADEALHPFVAHYRWRERASVVPLAELVFPALAPGMGRAAMALTRLRERRRGRALSRRGENWVRGEFERHLDAIDALCEGRRWLVGDAPSVADLGVAAQLHALTLGLTPEPLAWLRARPHASAWLERFLARASPRAS